MYTGIELFVHPTHCPLPTSVVLKSSSLKPHQMQRGPPSAARWNCLRLAVTWYSNTQWVSQRSHSHIYYLLIKYRKCFKFNPTPFDALWCSRTRFCIETYSRCSIFFGAVEWIAVPICKNCIGNLQLAVRDHRYNRLEGYHLKVFPGVFVHSQVYYEASASQNQMKLPSLPYQRQCFRNDWI